MRIRLLTATKYETNPINWYILLHNQQKIKFNIDNFIDNITKNKIIDIHKKSNTVQELEINCIKLLTPYLPNIISKLDEYNISSECDKKYKYRNIFKNY